MLGFLKIFLQGILYVVLSPLILLTLAVYAVYCVLAFIYIAIRSIIVFFMGGTPLGDLPEDVEAKRILMERAEQSRQDSTQALANALVQSQMQIAQSMYSQPNANPLPQPTPTEQPNKDEFTYDDLDDGENEIEVLDDDGRSY